MVVCKVDVVPGEAFCGVLCLGLCEDGGDEEVLELFVGVVDAELLKGVFVKDLKPVDVEDADGDDGVVVLACEGGCGVVDL